MMKQSNTDAAAAKQMASKAKSAVSDIQKDVKKIQESAVTKDQVKTLVDTAVQQSMNANIQASERRANTTTDDNDTTTVFGGLESLSLQESENWIARKLSDLHLQSR